MIKSQKIGIKRQKRKTKAALHIKQQRDLMKRPFRLVSKSGGKAKKPKPVKSLKPYKAVKLQKKHDAAYAEVRKYDHNDPRRAKALGKLSVIKRKLGQ